MSKKRKAKYKYARRIANASRIKMEFVRIKGGKCEMCGYETKVMGVFTFHHLCPALKRFTLSGQNLVRIPYHKLIEELNKCQLLCLNCHCEFHAGEVE